MKRKQLVACEIVTNRQFSHLWFFEQSTSFHSPVENIFNILVLNFSLEESGEKSQFSHWLYFEQSKSFHSTVENIFNISVFNSSLREKKQKRTLKK